MTKSGRATAPWTIAGLVAAAVTAVAAAGLIATSARAGAPESTGAHVRASAAADVQTPAAAQVSGPAAGDQTPAASPSATAGQVPPGTAASTTQVPWGEVGSGWLLTMYSTGSIGSGATTLYLVSPEGARYAIHHWRHGTYWALVAMSPAGTQALFQETSYTGGGTHVYLMNLESGAVSGFSIPSDADAIGYGPRGTSVLVARTAGIWLYSRTGVARYDLSALNTGEPNYATSGALVSPAGSDIVVGDGSGGLALIRPSGRLVRLLPVPHIATACSPVRWQSAAVILATCIPDTESRGPEVFAVPADGAQPTAVTQVRNFNSIDFGDTDAWSLGGKTFVQAETGCGPEFLGLQHRNGNVTEVTMPGDGSGSVVDAITGDQMMITRASCEGFNLLIRLDPLTGQYRMIFSGTQGPGAYSVVADNRDGSQP